MSTIVIGRTRSMLICSIFSGAADPVTVGRDGMMNPVAFHVDRGLVSWVILPIFALLRA